MNLSLSITTAPRCSDCAHLEISGTYKPHPLDKCEKPLRVQSVRDGVTINHGDFVSIELARAGACGTKGAVILQRQVPVTDESGTRNFKRSR